MSKLNVSANPTLSQILDKLEGRPVREIDLQFSAFLKELDRRCEALELVGFLLSQTLGQGNICLDFSQSMEFIEAEQLSQLQQVIAKSEVVEVLGPEELMNKEIHLPLVLHGSRLYLQRYWLYEASLHDAISKKLKAMPWQVAGQWEMMQELFTLTKNEDAQNLDWQAVAACVSANKQFSVISGGPGTGKTTTVIRLLALLINLYQSHFKRLPIIKLAAPTGKAAMRLTESINGAKQKLQIDNDIKKHIPSEASTLHRLLGRNRRSEFKYNHINPLHLDVLIVDEASMVDLPLMSKLLDAMPEHGQIILLGDKDQLASVEAGSVLADICDNETQHGFSESNAELINTLSQQVLDKCEIEKTGSSLRDHVCQLRTSYRFHENSGIGHLARAANKGSFSAWQKAAQAGFEDLNLIALKDESFSAFIKDSAKEYKTYTSLIDLSGMTDAQVLEVHEAFNQFQILTALREGPLGVAGLNQAIESDLFTTSALDNTGAWYMGRPLMVMENDYGMNLYNGDIGIILPLKDELGVIRPKVAFIGGEGEVRWIQPSRLPAHETVYAMTVHKSQGSEFSHCALVLPDYHASVISKELIYTGITRAKQNLTLLARESVVISGLKSRVQRSSGLRDRLWPMPKAVLQDKKDKTLSPNSPDIEIESSEPNQFSLF